MYQHIFSSLAPKGIAAPLCSSSASGCSSLSQRQHIPGVFLPSGAGRNMLLVPFAKNSARRRDVFQLTQPPPTHKVTKTGRQKDIKSQIKGRHKVTKPEVKENLLIGLQKLLNLYKANPKNGGSQNVWVSNFFLEFYIWNISSLHKALPPSDKRMQLHSPTLLHPPSLTPICVLLFVPF